jgi:hypothetical protein
MTEQEDNDERADAVRALIKRALRHDRVTGNAPDILRGVQRRIRQRSRGRFFADGWSTSQVRHGYVLIALMTLLVVAVAYCALSPLELR